MNDYVEGFDAGMDFAAHQLSLERQEAAYRALETLSKGQGGEKEIIILADELRIPNPLNKGKA